MLKAVEEIEKREIPENRQLEKFVLEYDNMLYPPKYVISISNLFANNKELDPSEFHGGEEANTFLQ